MTTLPAPIDAVTVYRAGALIARSARIDEASAAPEVVEIAGLPLCLEDRSVRVRVEGGSGLLAVEVTLGLERAAVDPALAPAESAALRAARREVARIEDALKHLGQQARRLEAEIAVARPAGREGEAPPPAPYAGREAVAAMRAELLAAIDRDAEAARLALRAAKEALAAIEVEERAASSARQARSHELRKRATIRLARSAGATGPRSLVLEYMVPGAKWAPAYTVTFDRAFARATVAVRAVVAQRSGEDWRGVRLTLSTADVQRWTELPELQSVRIGRRQAAAARRGWRPAPEGAAALYADYDAFMGRGPEAAEPAALDLLELESPEASGAAFDGVSQGAFSADDEGGAPWEMARQREEMVTRAGTAGPPPPASRAMPPRAMMSAAPPPMAPMMAAMPPPSPAAMPARKRGGGLFGSIGGGGAPPGGPPLGGAPQARRPEPTPEPEPLTPGDLLAYGDLRMPPPSSARRGELVLVRRLERVRELVLVREEATIVEICAALDRAAYLAGEAGSALPPRHRAPAAVGGFDYIYPAEGAVEVISDGDYHAIPLFAREARVELVHVAVPREGPEVFRVVRLHSPLDAPLLAGPADIYVGGEYALTSDLPLAAARGEVQIGLGVEQGVKVARNTRYAEESAGLIGGSLLLRHQVTIEVENRLARAIDLELRERLPTTQAGEDEIVVEASADPAWEPYEPEEYALKGGQRWRARVAGATKASFKANYSIKISAKKELVGGNRRES